MVKVVFFEVEDWEKDYLKSSLMDFDLSFSDKSISQEEVNFGKDAEIISIFVGSQINKDLLEKLPNLKMIATRSTGFDHVDLEIAKSKSISVCNVPTYGENTVAEH